MTSVDNHERVSKHKTISSKQCIAVVPLLKFIASTTAWLDTIIINFFGSDGIFSTISCLKNYSLAKWLISAKKLRSRECNMWKLEYSDTIHVTATRSDTIAYCQSMTHITTNIHLAKYQITQQHICSNKHCCAEITGAESDTRNYWLFQ